MGQGSLRRSGGGDRTDDEIFTAATGQGLVVLTGILGDLVPPEGTFDSDRADEIRELAAQAAVYTTQARGSDTLRCVGAWMPLLPCSGPYHDQPAGGTPDAGPAHRSAE
jgi:hypothetical protein